MKPHILIVDDEANILITLRRTLEDEGYTVTTFENGKETLENFKSGNFAAAFLDVMMPEMDGLQLLQALKLQDPSLCCIMMSAHGTIGTALQATRLGAYDFLEKPVGIEKLLLTLENGITFENLRKENTVLKEHLGEKYALLGDGTEMKKLRDQIERISKAGAHRILITGESGTGKELAAWAIHNSGDRAGKPFIRVNCAAIPKDLIESELFGYEPGAFTGASRQKLGRFEQADSGTLFLDEIGDMSPETQAKVLRVLQENQFERLGGRKTINVDIRVIAATNRDLKSMMKSGEFREDLYFRLNIIEIKMPPLRTRKEDIPQLVISFLKTYAVRNGTILPEIEKEAILLFQKHIWKGNVRELKNMTERCAIMSGGLITEKVVKESIGQCDSDVSFGNEMNNGSFHVQMEKYESMVIKQALEISSGNISKAAKLLCLSRSHLHKKITALGLNAQG